MQFDPKDADSVVLKEGDTCDFEIISAVDAVSKRSNKEMIKLNIKAWDSEGTQSTFFYYLMFPWQIKQFCEATNQLDKFMSGKFEANDALGKCGKFISRIEKDPTGQYADKTAIKKFIKTVNAENNNMAANTPTGFIDDDIPF